MPESNPFGDLFVKSSFSALLAPLLVGETSAALFYLLLRGVFV